MKQRIIFHVDVNSAYLSWEAVHRLKDLGEEIDLREIPAIIGGDESRRRGIVLAASIPAKQFGIQTAETVREAVTKCPEVKICRPDHDMYRRYSRAFIEEALKFSPEIEFTSLILEIVAMDCSTGFVTVVSTVSGDAP